MALRDRRDTAPLAIDTRISSPFLMLDEGERRMAEEDAAAMNEVTRQTGTPGEERTLVQKVFEPFRLRQKKLRRLIRAIKRQRVEKVAKLLEQKAVVAAINEPIATTRINPLIAAVTSTGNWEIVKMLVEVGADVNFKGPHNRSPLHWASLFGDVDVAKYLLSQGAQVEARDDQRNTPLHEAAFGGNYDALELLLEKGADPNVLDNSGYTALHKAAFVGSNHCILSLLKYPIDIDAKDDEGGTPLHNAIYNSHYDCVQTLLQFNAGVDKVDKKGRSAVRFAVHADHPRILKLLLDRKADLTLEDEQGVAPIHVAAFKGFSNVLSTLLAAGVGANVKSKDGNTPLHFAASKGDISCGLILLSAGAEVNTPDAYQNTPLHLAVKNEHTGFAALLLHNGADVSYRSKSGKTALHYALQGSDEVTVTRLAEMLITKGAKLDVANEDGFSPLDIIVEKSIDISAFSDVELPDPKGRESLKEKPKSPVVVPALQVVSPRDSKPKAEVVPEETLAAPAEVKDPATADAAPVPAAPAPEGAPAPPPPAMGAPGGPPPPPGMPGAPPAPGMAPVIDLGRDKLRRLDWEKVPDTNIPGTIFAKFDDVDKLEIDTAGLQKNFFIKDAKKKQGLAGDKSAVALIPDAEVTRQLEVLLRSQAHTLKTRTDAPEDRHHEGETLGETRQRVRMQTIKYDNLQRSQFKDSLMKNMLQEYPISFLKSIATLAPAENEFGPFRAFKGNPGLLGIADSFFWTLADVPNLKERVSACLFAREFDGVLEELNQDIETLQLAVDEVANSKKLREVYKYILAIVNYLNAGHMKFGQPITAKGFKPQSLTLLKNMRATTAQTNLLRHIVGVLYEQDKELLRLPEDFSHLDASWQEKTDTIMNKPRELELRLRSIKEFVTGLQPMSSQDKYPAMMTAFCARATPELEALKAKAGKTLKAYLNLHTMFGYPEYARGKEKSLPGAQPIQAIQGESEQTPVDDERLLQAQETSSEVATEIGSGDLAKAQQDAKRLSLLLQSIAAPSAPSESDNSGGAKKIDIFTSLYQFIEDFKAAVRENENFRMRTADAEKRRKIIEEKRLNVKQKKKGDTLRQRMPPKGLRDLADLQEFDSHHLMQMYSVKGAVELPEKEEAARIERRERYRSPAPEEVKKMAEEVMARKEAQRVKELEAAQQALKEFDIDDSSASSDTDTESDDDASSSSPKVARRSSGGDSQMEKRRFKWSNYLGLNARSPRGMKEKEPKEKEPKDNAPKSRLMRSGSRLGLLSPRNRGADMINNPSPTSPRGKPQPDLASPRKNTESLASPRRADPDAKDKDLQRQKSQRETRKEQKEKKKEERKEKKKEKKAQKKKK